MENWKEIKGYEGLYMVSDLGRIKRIVGYQRKKEKVLKQLDNGTKYMGVSLSKNGKPRRRYTHRIVAEAFLDNPKNKEEVNHIDGNRKNNKLSNLEWATRSENHFHRYKVLKQRGVNYGKTGAKNWNSKPCLKHDLKGNLLKRYAGVMEAGRQNNISEANIRSNIYGKTKQAGGFIWEYE